MIFYLIIIKNKNHNIYRRLTVGNTRPLKCKVRDIPE